MSKFELYADGACQPNPGVGGWGFVLRNIDTLDEITSSGSTERSTNNRMELQGVMEGIKYFRENIKDTRLTLILDSKYVLGGIFDWSPNWIKNGWKRKDGKPVKNSDLWKELLSLVEGLNIRYRHVKGHSGEKQNEKCDRLATRAIKERKP